MSHINLSFAVSSGSQVIYALPTQAQGTFVAAQDLFIGKQGGLWIHDVHGRLMFFDGKHTLPKHGSLLDYPTETVAYHDGEFWTFVENEVYRTKPNLERELVFRLKPGSEIRRIGVSQNYVWLSDGINFYTYHVYDSELETYPLATLYQNNQSSHVYINDAIRVGRRWVIATTSGSYLSDGYQFSHLPPSKKHNNSKIYYSPSRHEILVGSRRGAVLVDLARNISSDPFIGETNVTAIVENEQGYWVGTEQGLYLYSFATETVVPFDTSVDGIPIGRLKIMSLATDDDGGIWIATSRGIFYYSPFSQHFLRTVKEDSGYIFDKPGVGKIERNDDGALWYVTKDFLYRKSESPHQIAKTRLPVEINDFAADGNSIWLASFRGLYRYVHSEQRFEKMLIADDIDQLSLEHIELDKQGNIWFSSGFQLFSYNVTEAMLQRYGDEWPVRSYLPSKITGLEHMDGISMLVRTAHGIYIVKDKKVIFERLTSSFGTSIDVAQGADGAFWYASSYGIYKSIPRGNGFQNVELPLENARPACLISEPHGMWLASSVGLSLYSTEGLLVRHFGMPLGLINNEFVANSCPELALQSNQIVLGSRYGIVQVDRQTLVTAPIPEPQIVISQVVINQKVHSIGQMSTEIKDVPYGSSLRLMFGVLPLSANQTLFYRLDDGSPWLEIESGQLTLEKTCCLGTTLQLTTSPDADSIRTIQIHTLQPWFYSPVTISAFAGLFVLFLAAFSYWRSQVMVKNNKRLSAQVELKTQQLNHQSRVLLNNNQQLRKQNEIKAVLVSRLGRSIKQKLAEMSENWASSESRDDSLDLLALYQIVEELEGTNLQHIAGSSAHYDLDYLVRSVMDVWRDEADSKQLTLSYSGIDEVARVSVMDFNLDIILNTLFSSAVKRAYLSQTIEVTLRVQGTYIALSMLDYGSSLELVDENVSDPSYDYGVAISLQQLPALVESSGGDVGIYCSDSRNKVEIVWPRANPEEAVNRLAQLSKEEERPDATQEQAWLLKVKDLVNDHYPDANFGTALAAKKLYVSERSLQRRFKSLSEQTFMEYLTEIRLERACERLLSGEKIADVAFLSGFNDASYFSLRFKNHFGMSPSKFVSEHKASLFH